MRNRWRVLLTLFLVLGAAGPALADVTRTQTIDLTAGWNAVFMEVTPLEADMDAVLDGTPVSQVLAYFPKAGAVQYIQDPSEVDWRNREWRRWIPSDQPAAVLNDLHALQAGRAYLMFASADRQWDVAGTAPKFLKREWRPDSFNFLGFYVDPAAPPTFLQYFEGSEAHADFRVYELRENQWRPVADPGGVNIASGRAYWIWCDGGSDYPGPMEIETPAIQSRVDFTATAAELDVSLTNRSPNPLTFTIEQISNASGDQLVPLSVAVFDPTAAQDNKTYDPLTVWSPATALEPGEKRSVSLAVERKAIASDTVSGLLKITDDLGDVVYIPVTAEK